MRGYYKEKEIKKTFYLVMSNTNHYTIFFKYNEDLIQIKLVVIETLVDLSEMFYNCDRLISFIDNSEYNIEDISKIEILGYDYTNIIDNLNNKEIKTDDISENC